MRINPFVSTVIVLLLTVSATAQKMTYEEAKKLTPDLDLPEFWIADVEQLADRWANLERGDVTTTAKSPGGRPLHLIAYGQREEQESTTNFNSAIAARKPSAYVDKASRKKPVIYLVGPVHGQETEGLVALVNLIQVMETGRDLRDRDQSTLRSLGQKCRLLIIPVGNPDGMARFEPRTSCGLSGTLSAFWGMGTWSDDTIAHWPSVKRPHPRVGPSVGFLGCYFNDDGINPMHDEFFAPMAPEAPAILRVARQEGPDLAVSLHSHESPTAILRPAYVPMEVQQEVQTLAERYYGLLDEAELPHNKPFTPSPEQGKSPAPFNLVSAIYHTSGATTLTFESPRGVTDEKACQVDFDQILDIHLLLFKAMMQHALDGQEEPQP